MTTINVIFPGTWVTDLASLVSVQVFKVDRTEQSSHAGSVRVYAGGRRRIITGPAVDRSSAMTLHRVSPADVETLRGWCGRLLLIRDAQGWRHFGAFFDLQVVSVFQGANVAPTHSVSLTWTDSDFLEAV